MTYRVTHTTTYRYGKVVSLCHNLVHLTPRTYTRQTCLVSQLQVTPAPKLFVEQADFFGNRATYFMVDEPHEQLTLTAVSETEVVPFAAPDSARSARLLRNVGMINRNAATSVVVSSHTSCPPALALVMTWLNCEGDGNEGSSSCAELINTAEAFKPAASIKLVNRVCLSLQSPYCSRSTSPAARR